MKTFSKSLLYCVCLVSAAACHGAAASSCFTGPFVVFFEFDSTRWDGKAAKTLQHVLDLRGNCGFDHVYVAGHADQIGNEAYNMHLSKRRAEVVFHYLRHRGIESEQITIAAFGEQQPLVSAKTGSIKLNRRVEISFGPPPDKQF